MDGSEERRRLTPLHANDWLPSLTKPGFLFAIYGSLCSATRLLGLWHRLNENVTAEGENSSGTTIPKPPSDSLIAFVSSTGQEGRDTNAITSAFPAVPWSSREKHLIDAERLETRTKAFPAAVRSSRERLCPTQKDGGLGAEWNVAEEGVDLWLFFALFSLLTLTSRVASCNLLKQSIVL